MPGIWNSAPHPKHCPCPVHNCRPADNIFPGFQDIGHCQVINILLHCYILLYAGIYPDWITLIIIVKARMNSGFYDWTVVQRFLSYYRWTVPEKSLDIDSFIFWNILLFFFRSLLRIPPGAVPEKENLLQPRLHRFSANRIPEAARYGYRFDYAE